jgi:NTP pyrophosphatase (non-canonical NTP hydrolase)
MMELSEISKINRARCERWHAGGEEWTAADWGVALGGEAGELLNVIKKVRRHETGVVNDLTYNTPPLPEVLAAVKDEIADVFLYLDLVANHFDLELEECIFPKFNRVSKAQGFPERLGND